MLLRFHEDVVRKGPWPVQDQELIGGIIVKVPVTAQQPRKPHKNGGRHGGPADAPEVAFRGVQRLHQDPCRAEDSQDAGTRMRQKYEIAGSNIHMSVAQRWIGRDGLVGFPGGFFPPPCLLYQWRKSMATLIDGRASPVLHTSSAQSPLR